MSQAPLTGQANVQIRLDIKLPQPDFPGQCDTTSEPSSIPTRQMTQRNQILLRPPGRPLLRLASGDRSSELLLPPESCISKNQRRTNSESPVASSSQGLSPMQSSSLSRRSSLASEVVFSDKPGLGQDSVSYIDSRASSRLRSQDVNVNTQTVSEKYNILPSAALFLFPEDVEKDDWLHNPIPGEDESRQCDILSSRGLLNIGGLAFLTLGILLLFIGYPVITFVDKIVYPQGTGCIADPDCIRVDLPLLQNVRQGLIDPDTPESTRSRIARDGSTQYLVFSDEFNKPGRSFYANDDPYFEAVDLWYGATMDLEWYDPDAVTTAEGVLTIRLDEFKNHGLNYRSGMLQSWNQLCFKGGYIEASISLPGDGQTIGFWPGFWTMGNLGRPGYMATTEGLWPYSYWNTCDYGITANQSSSDGLSFLPGMRLPACTCPEAVHPSPGISRSAPEIDALEASVGYLDEASQTFIGTASQSCQLAPFDVWYQPDYDFVEVYDTTVTMMNSYRGGHLQQAVSALTNLNNDWYNGKGYQKYGFEYSPGAEGYSTWFVGDKRTWTVDGRAVGPNGNIGQRIIPEEPLSIVANFGISENFATVNFTGIQQLLPATMRFDYIRIYQGSNDLITCDPPGYPTTDYIERHPKAYRNAQKTTWASAGYSWPNNSFVNGCEAWRRSVLM